MNIINKLIKLTILAEYCNKFRIYICKKLITNSTFTLKI